MQRRGVRAADWRDAEAYAPLLAAERSIFAWEWLRRNEAYRSAALGTRAQGQYRRDGPAAGAWGLHRFEDPDLSAPEARPVWNAQVHPYVVAVEAVPTVPGSDAFNLSRISDISTLLTANNGREHLLISDGLRAIRLDIHGGTLLGGPVRLRYQLDGFAVVEKPLLTLRRLLLLWRAGNFSRTLHRRETRARRWLLMLRAHDAVAAGADQREIAAELLSRRAGEPRWRSRAPSLRSQVQRLVGGARLMVHGRYRDLLR